MTNQSAGEQWRYCPGCGRERRLASGGGVMCVHNRWDSAAWAMVPCEGSGREPDLSAGPYKAGGQVAGGAAGQSQAGGRVAAAGLARRAG